MIYGNKLLDTDNLAIITLEQDISNIHESLKYFNDDFLKESMDIDDIILKVVTKIKEALMKILDAVSKLFKKVLPFVYNTIQKLITKINNSMKTKFDQTKYEGKKEFIILELNNKAEKLASDAKSADFAEDIKMMQIINNKYFLAFKSKDIADAIKEINPSVIKFNESIKKKLEPFEDILSLETYKEFYDKRSYTVESANDYETLKTMLTLIIDSNKQMTDDMRNMERSIGSMITSLQLSHLGNKIGIDMAVNNSNIIKDLDMTSLSKVPKIYSKILDIYMGAIRSQVKVINEISKYGKYDITISNGDELITKHGK